MEELSTEQKIVAAAHRVFTKKGYAASRTRDIAEEAGINLALLNYYFKSKENLFKIIVMEKFTQLFGQLTPIISDANVSLDDKIKTLVEYYTELLIENEDLPIFVLNELKNNEQIFDHILQFARNLSQPVIERQMQEEGFTLSVSDLVVNVISLSIFPFVAKPLLISSGIVTREEFPNFVAARQKKIPTWIAKISK